MTLIEIFFLWDMFGAIGVLIGIFIVAVLWDELQ